MKLCLGYGEDGCYTGWHVDVRILGFLEFVGAVYVFGGLALFLDFTDAVKMQFPKLSCPFSEFLDFVGAASALVGPPCLQWYLQEDAPFARLR